MRSLLLLLHIHNNITDPGLMEEGCGVTCVEVEVGCGFTGMSCGGTRGGGDGDLDICLPEMGLQEDNSKLYMHQKIGRVHHT